MRSTLLLVICALYCQLAAEQSAVEFIDNRLNLTQTIAENLLASAQDQDHGQAPFLVQHFENQAMLVAAIKDSSYEVKARYVLSLLDMAYLQAQENPEEDFVNPDKHELLGSINDNRNLILISLEQEGLE